MTDETLFAPRGRRLMLGLLLAVAVACVWVWVSNDRETSRFDQAMDRFEAPREWTVVAQSRQPARKVCLSEGGCPSAWTRWTVPGPVAPLDLDALLDRAGWDMSLDENCPGSGAVRLVGGLNPRNCGAHGQADGYRVTVTQHVLPDSGLVEVVVRLESREDRSWVPNPFSSSQ
ncbi:hypothetical protein [Nocardioides sp. 616]|uniref:hypothetical protein n=1 Tax=Nocardioides sp. 616 TaxID=2268090 RepID=UPI000CE33A4F|nr:hypothetical protein [Nocardioides sp. 616]